MAKKLGVKVRLTADTKDAERNIGKAERSFSALGKTLAKIALPAAAAVAAVVGITRAIGGLISASSKQIDAENALNASLIRLGDQAGVTSKALQEQAAALERVTRFSDETIIKSQALLGTFGLTAEQMKGATQATVDLAAAFGLDLESAARNVGRTFSGTAGELAELIPQLRELDAEALKAGGALKVFEEVVGGRAVEDAKTFSGRIEQLSNAFGTLNEKLGDAITRNRDISKSLGELRDIIASAEFIGGVERLAKGMSAVASAMVNASTAIPDFLRGARDLNQTFQDFRDSGTLAGDAVDLLSLKLEQLKTVRLAGARVIGSMISDVTKLGALRKKEALITAEVARNEQVLAFRRGELSNETKIALPLFEAFAALQERINEGAKESLSREETIAGRDAEALKALDDAVNEAGLSIKLFSEETAKQEQAIEAAEDAFKRGAISVERYEAILEAARNKLAELNGATGDTGTAVRDLADAFDRGGERADAFGEKLGNLKNQMDGTTPAASSLASATGGGIRARFSFNQASVDAALAAGNKPFLNGTRIKTLDGGSVLIDGSG